MIRAASCPRGPLEPHLRLPVPNCSVGKTEVVVIPVFIWLVPTHHYHLAGFQFQSSGCPHSIHPALLFPESVESSVFRSLGEFIVVWPREENKKRMTSPEKISTLPFPLVVFESRQKTDFFFSMPKRTSRFVWVFSPATAHLYPVFTDGSHRLAGGRGFGSVTVEKYH